MAVDASGGATPMQANWIKLDLSVVTINLINSHNDIIVGADEATPKCSTSLRAQTDLVRCKRHALFALNS